MQKNKVEKQEKDIANIIERYEEGKRNIDSCQRLSINNQYRFISRKINRITLRREKASFLSNEKFNNVSLFDYA